MQAWQVVAGFAALAQQRGGQQSAEPRRVLEWFDRGPRLCRDRCCQRRRQRAALCDDDTPRVEPGVLVPVGIVDQWVPFRRTALLTGAVSDKHAVGLGDRGIDGSEDVGELIVGWGHLTRLGRVGVGVVDAECRAAFNNENASLIISMA
jgi:hypothetical protein